MHHKHIKWQTPNSTVGIIHLRSTNSHKPTRGIITPRANPTSGYIHIIVLTFQATTGKNQNANVNLLTFDNTISFLQTNQSFLGMHLIWLVYKHIGR